MLSADAGAGALTLSGIDTYDGGLGSPAFVTVDSPVAVTGVAFQNYYSTVGSTDRGSITISESTAVTPATCAFCAGAGSITLQHSLTSNVRTSTGPIKVMRSRVGSSTSIGGPANPSIWSNSGPITVENSSVSYAVAGIRSGGGTSTVRSSTVRPLTSGPAIELSGAAALTATTSILTCSSAGGAHSGGHNITDGTCGFAGVGDQVADPLVSLTTIGSAANNSMAIDIGFMPALGSPAIDKGAVCGTIDQRGFARPVDGDRDLARTCDVARGRGASCRRPGG
jgi:hypothetical protein